MGMLKKALLLGLGAMSLTREKAEQFYNEVIEKGQMNKEEARQLVDEILKKGEEEKKEIRSYIQEEFNKFKNEFSPVTRAEFEALEARVRELEQKNI